MRGDLELSRRDAIAETPFSRGMQMACWHVTREEGHIVLAKGILGVDISIAYGEGASRAFFRLVREVFDTKKNVMDLFNRTYYNWGEKLFPSSLESYRCRFVRFDLPDGGSSLDHFSPLEPIVFTQLGVRIPLFLAPGLVVTSDTTELKDYAPKGALCGCIPFSRVSANMARGHCYTSSYATADSTQRTWLISVPP